jgi:cytochrome bd-type quinol oxidase subunit 2
MEENQNNRKMRHFSDLEVGVLDNKYRNFVQKSSLAIVFLIIALFIISPAFFDRLQYEDGYVENLTVAFLLIAIAGIGKYLFKSASSEKRNNWKYLFVMLQLIGFLSVALYASLQELEFGQRALGYEMSDTSKEVTKGNGMNLHHRENMELFLTFGAIVFSTYTVLIPYILRKPWIESLIPTSLAKLETWTLKIPRSLVPAFLAGTALALLQTMSLFLSEELEEFNEYAEVCFAYAFALLGAYLWEASSQDRFN